MDAKLKRKWVKALRSGEYKQARGVLRDKNGAMCCLGVLCAIQGASVQWMEERNKSLELDDFANGLGPGARHKLAQMNDGHGEPRSFAQHGEPRSFAQIADYIEKHL